MSTATSPPLEAFTFSTSNSVSMVARALAGLAHQDLGDAARDVAAGTSLAAVGVLDPHEHVGALRGLHRDHLIAADAQVTVGDRARGIARQIEGLLPPVEYDEVIAQTLHFDEGQAFSWRALAHDRRYMGEGGPKSTG